MGVGHDSRPVLSRWDGDAGDEGQRNKVWKFKENTALCDFTLCMYNFD